MDIAVGNDKGIQIKKTWDDAKDNREGTLIINDNLSWEIEWQDDADNVIGHEHGIFIMNNVSSDFHHDSNAHWTANSHK